MSAWLPIDSAPKDGTAVLLFAPRCRDHAYFSEEGFGHFVVGLWSGKEVIDGTDLSLEPQWRSDIIEEFCEYFGAQHARIRPTHWMPIPPARATEDAA